MKKFLLAISTLLLISTTATASTILLTEYDYGNSYYNSMKTNLENAGHTVDIVDAKIAGNIATSLGSASYDQVFLWDLTSTQYINQADINALKSFFTEHDSLVIDSRSYGYYYQGTNTSEVALLQNIASEFEYRNGGLWIGTDHDPVWTRNSNLVLTALGVETITGSYSQAVNDYDTNSVLLDGVDPYALWAEGASVGSVPLGIQSNGLDMRFHFGHSSDIYGAIPYISASFGDYITDDEDPNDHYNDNPVPEPATILLFGLGILGLAGVSRKKTA